MAFSSKGRGLISTLFWGTGNIYKYIFFIKEYLRSTKTKKLRTVQQRVPPNTDFLFIFFVFFPLVVQPSLIDTTCVCRLEIEDWRLKTAESNLLLAELRKALRENTTE